MRIKTNRKSVSTPSWATPYCGTHLQLWSWCCSPKVSFRELLWQCACRRFTCVSLSLIFRTRSWRWILMMTCRVLPAGESQARAKPLRSSFPICTRTYVEKPNNWCKCVWAVRVSPSQPRDLSEGNEWCMLRCLLQKNKKNKKTHPSFLWTFLYVTWMAGYPTRMTHHQKKRRAGEEKGWWVRGLEVGINITGGLWRRDHAVHLKITCRWNS